LPQGLETLAGFSSLKAQNREIPKLTDHSAIGRRSKRKGSSNERQIAKILQEYWGHGSWARTPASGGWAYGKHKEAFNTAGDIITTAPDWPWCCELKKHEGWTLDQLLHNEKPEFFNWWKQCVDATPDGQIPLLIAGRNRIPPIVAFDPLHYFKVFDNLPWLPKQHFDVKLDNNSFIIMGLQEFLTINPVEFGRDKTKYPDAKVP